MKSAPKRFGSVVLFAVFASAIAVSCSDAPRSPVSPADAVASFAKSTAGVSVKSTNPAFGDQGQTNESVTITGSGFQPGAQVAMLHNGTVDPTIVVSSSQVVNSTTIVAVINIDPNSPLDFRDVQVTNFDRTQGIGAAVFEVTQAQIIPGALAGRGVTDNGEVTGSLTSGPPFYYNISTGLLQTLASAPGSGFAISPRGDAIAGSAGSGNGFPYLYTRPGPIGTAWTATALPIGATATGGTANALITDPVTGQVTLIGGFETVPGAKTSCTNALIWSWQASTNGWQRIVLPSNGGCAALVKARGLSANGTAVGGTGNAAAVWTPDGSGGYTLTELTDGWLANGINADASMIVGQSISGHPLRSAVYWRRSAGGWGSAIPFVGGCTDGRDISDVSGRVTLLDCVFPGSSAKYASYMDAPYTTATKLGGVGGHDNNFVGGISPSGNYMVGYGFTSGNVQVGVYWRP